MEKSLARNEAGAVIKDKPGGKRKKSIYEEWKKNKRTFIATAGNEVTTGDDDSYAEPNQAPSHKQAGNAGGAKSELVSESDLRKKRKQKAHAKKSTDQLRREKQEILKKRFDRRSKGAWSRSKKIIPR